MSWDWCYNLEDLPYRGQPMQKLTRNLLKAIGVVLIVVGIIAAYFGPLEIYVFYLFSAGGPFYHEGFGVGSFWFAVLVVMNIGYYAIAAICLPAGIGHVKLRRWGYTLTHLYLWFWLGAGIWLAGNLLLLIPSALKLDLSRDVLWMRMALAVVFDTRQCGLVCFEQTTWNVQLCASGGDAEGRAGGGDCFGLYKVQKGFNGIIQNAGVQVKRMVPCLKIWQRL
jgi:hypothetical protein